MYRIFKKVSRSRYKYIVFLIIIFCSALYFSQKSVNVLIRHNSEKQFSNYKLFTKDVKHFISINKEVDEFLRYLVIKNVQNAWNEPSINAYKIENDITLVTQCSVNHIFNIVGLSQTWRGPMSLALFIDPHHFQLAMQVIFKMLQCYPDVFSSLHLSLVFPFINQTDLLTGHHKYILAEKTCQTFKNNLLAKEDDQINYQSTQYPVNLLRNTAIRASQSSHVLVVDVDMRTSLNLNHHLLNYMNNKQFLWKQNFAFVIPVFEMPSASKLPENKEELKELIGRNECRIFYEGVCRKCHQPTDYHKWLSLQLPTLEAAYEVAWKPSWEPFYLVPTTAPLYPEEFEHYGFNRLTQSCELHMAGYRFLVLDHAFLVHLGLKQQGRFHHHKEAHERWNRMLYLQFVQDLPFKYPLSNRNCLSHIFS